MHTAGLVPAHPGAGSAATPPRARAALHPRAGDLGAADALGTRARGSVSRATSQGPGSSAPSCASLPASRGWSRPVCGSVPTGAVSLRLVGRRCGDDVTKISLGSAGGVGGEAGGAQLWLPSNHVQTRPRRRGKGSMRTLTEASPEYQVRDFRAAGGKAEGRGVGGGAGGRARALIGQLEAQLVAPQGDP